MTKAKLGIAVFAATLALTAVASATALAGPGWMVNGITLGAGEVRNVAEATVVDQNFTLGAAGVTIQCEQLRVEGGFIEALSMALAKSLIFSGCESLNAPTCTVTKTIGTVPILGTASLDAANASAAIVTFTPETKTVFATIKYDGASCALLGVQPVTGKATTLAPEGKIEKVEQRLNVNSSGELKVGSSEATLKGGALLKLENGLSWSYL